MKLGKTTVGTEGLEDETLGTTISDRVGEFWVVESIGDSVELG